MPIRDPNNPHPARSTAFDEANRRYERELLSRVGPHPACFAAATPVLTPSGAVPIEALAAGDAVLAPDAGGRLRPRAVLRVTRARRRTVTLRFEGSDAALATTPHHALLGAHGWVRCARLRPGSRLWRLDAGGRGCWVRVRAIEPGALPEPVHNLIVERELCFVASGFVAHSFAFLRGPRALWHRVGLALSNVRGPGPALGPRLLPCFDPLGADGAKHDNRMLS